MRQIGWTLTECDTVTPYGDIDVGQNWLSKALLPDGIKPLPEPMWLIIIDVLWHSHEGNFTGAWWRQQMETFPALLTICTGNPPVTGEFPAQRPVMRSFDVFFDLRLNKRLSKQSYGWWFETPWRPSWRHINGSSRSLFLLWVSQWLIDWLIQDYSRIYEGPRR